MLDEVELVKKVQQGDMAAFELLFERYKRMAIKTVYLMTGNQNVSEDIVQEAFVACYRSVKGLRKPELFKTWFFKLLTRTTWRYMKKERALLPVEDITEMVEQDCGKSYCSQGGKAEELERLHEEILSLDQKLQTTIILYYYNELSVKEIARVMGCLEGTVKSRLHTGRKKLKISLVQKEQFVKIGEV